MSKSTKSKAATKKVAGKRTPAGRRLTGRATKKVDGKIVKSAKQKTGARPASSARGPKAASRRAAARSATASKAPRKKSARPQATTAEGPFGLTPYIIVKDAGAAIAFYTKILGAQEKYRLTDPQGHVGHAEITIGPRELFLADESPAFGALAPTTVGGTPVRLHLYVIDVDDTIARAQAAGATVLRPAADQFYGDRAGMISDPFGHQWYLATRGKIVTPDEMQKLYSAMFTNG